MEKRKVVFVNRAYKTSVPKKIIEALNVKSGDYLEWSINNGTISVKKVEKGENKSQCNK